MAMAAIAVWSTSSPLRRARQAHNEFIIESSCNGMFGVPWNGDTIQSLDMNCHFKVQSGIQGPHCAEYAGMWPPVGFPDAP